MKRIVSIIAVAIAPVAASFRDGGAQAGGYDHGKATGSCSISPSPAAIGQPYTVSVSGLSLDTPDYLFIIPPNKAGYSGALEQQAFPDANGNWSGTFVADDPDDVGKWTYEFDTVSSPGGTRLALWPWWPRIQLLAVLRSASSASSLVTWARRSSSSDRAARVPR